MISYKKPDGRTITVEDEYQINIIPDILSAGKEKVANLQTGWFPAKPKYPAAVFYQLGEALTDYASNRAMAKRFTYYFEVRALKEPDKDKTARDLCSALAGIYEARRTQFDDSFEEFTGTYIKRITLIFTVKIGE